MSTAGPNSPSSVTQYTQAAPTSVGAWSNEGNVTDSDDARATSASLIVQDDATDTIRVGGFDFSIPLDATVTGIVAEVEASRTGEDITTVLAASVGENALGDESDQIATLDFIEVSTTEAYISFGSSTWNTDNGSPLDVAQINSADFFVDVTAQRTGTPDGIFGLQVLIDHIRVTIYYTAAGGPASYSLTADAGLVFLVGNTANLKRGLKRAAAAGSVSLAGVAVGLKSGRKIAAAAGSISLSGSATGLTRARSLTAAAGSLSLTGVTVSLGRGVTMSAGAGAFTLSGNAAPLVAARKLAAATGSFALTGQAAALSRVYRLPVSAGSIVLTSISTGLRAARTMPAGAGSFALTGIDATLTRRRGMGAATGSFSLSGVAASLRAARKLPAASGSITLTSIPTVLRRGFTLFAGSGAYSLAGVSAGVRKGSVLRANTGSIILTGSNAPFVFSFYPFTPDPAPPAFTVTGPGASGSWVFTPDARPIDF